MKSQREAMRKLNERHDVEYDPSGPFEEQLVRRTSEFDLKGQRRYKRLIIGKFALSIQASEIHYSRPRKTLDDPTLYERFELALFEGEDEKTEKWVNPHDDPRFEGLSVLEGWEDSDAGVRGYASVAEIDALIHRLTQLTEGS
jgi:hypothetical protein